MRTIIKVFCFIGCLTILSCANKSDEVYVSTGPTAKRYHLVEDCKGLSQAKEVIKVKKEIAIKAGRTPCHICAKGDIGMKRENEYTCVNLI